MSEAEALSWITDLFEETPGSLTAATPMAAIRKWDSLGILSLMAGLDQTFDLLVTADDTMQLKQVGDLLALLRRNRKLA